MPGPLDGIRVVELGASVAVPAATHLLATQGAAVVKVETATIGDELRFVGTRKNGLGAWYLNVNAGKRSIALNLSEEAGRDALWRLIDTADVFVQGFRPGVVEQLGFAAEAVLERNPRLVYVSATGFGADGPYANRPAFDAIIQAMTGWAGAQQADGRPTLVRGFVADKVAAMTTAQAVTAGLLARERSGHGQHIQTSMLESNLAFVWPDVMMQCSLLDEDATHLPNPLTSIRLYECTGGWLATALGTDKMWTAFCEAMDVPRLRDDPRFATWSDRVANFEVWCDGLAETLAPVEVDKALELLVGRDIPVAKVLDPEEIHRDPHVVARGAVIESEHPVAGRFRAPRQGARFPGGEAVLLPAPTHGQHTDEVLAELGYDDAAIASLRARRVVA